MRIVSIIVLTVLFFLYLTGCKNEKPDAAQDTTTARDTTVEKVDKDSLLLHADIIRDSLQANWDAMIQSDDQKFENIKRLLQEISYTSQYNHRLHDSLVKTCDHVKNTRYTQETMNAESIDNYDALTDKYIARVMTLAGSSPELSQHPLAEELISEINEANTNTLIKLRVNYGRWVMINNSFVKAYKNELSAAGPPYSEMKEINEFMGSSNVQ
jgi:hypothetical protein